MKLSRILLARGLIATTEAQMVLIAVRVHVEHPTNRPSFTLVGLNDLSIWFSYRVPIAFAHPSIGCKARVNEWGGVTARHLAQVDPTPSESLPGTQFESMLSEVFSTVVGV